MNWQEILNVVRMAEAMPTPGSAFSTEPTAKPNATAPQQPSSQTAPTASTGPTAIPASIIPANKTPSVGGQVLSQTTNTPQAGQQAATQQTQASTTNPPKAATQAGSPDENNLQKVATTNQTPNADAVKRYVQQQNPDAQPKPLIGTIPAAGMTQENLEQFELEMSALREGLMTTPGVSDLVKLGGVGLATALGGADAGVSTAKNLWKSGYETDPETGKPIGKGVFNSGYGLDPTDWGAVKKPDDTSDTGDSPVDTMNHKLDSVPVHSADELLKDKDYLTAWSQMNPGEKREHMAALHQKYKFDDEQIAKFTKDIDDRISSLREGQVNEFSLPSWQDTKDFVGNVGNSVASDVKDAGNFVVGAANKVADTAKYAYNNPDQAAKDVKQGANKAWEKTVDTAKWAKDHPVDALKTVGQTADDAVRAAANMATFGYADKLAAKGNSLVKGTDYDAELTGQYQQDVDAAKRSPTATTVGNLAGAVLDPAFAAGAAATHYGVNALGRGIAKTATRAAPTVASTVSKAAKATSTALPTTTGAAKLAGKVYTDIKGGNAADEIAKAGIRQVDPDNIYAEPSTHESINRLQQLANYRNT